MNQAAASPAPAPDEPEWFGSSSRAAINGRPESRYGWLEQASGPCIVKEVNSHLAAFATGLLEHERKVLLRLRKEYAPVPACMAHPRTDWLVTGFAGLSMQLLAQAKGAARLFPPGERLAAWVHFLDRAHAFQQAGALPVDLWAGNLVLPLAEGTHGQLRLDRPVLIDHAHTLCIGMDMRRPLWIRADMERVAPELRAALRADQDRLKQLFQRAGAALPGSRPADARAGSLGERMWAEYDARQELQAELDAGRVDPGAAIQYAVAIALQNQALRAASKTRLLPVLARMRAPDPARRFRSLHEAHQACVEALGNLPRAGAHRHAAVGPSTLRDHSEKMATTLAALNTTVVGEAGATCVGGQDAAAPHAPQGPGAEQAAGADATFYVEPAAPAAAPATPYAYMRSIWWWAACIAAGVLAERLLPWPGGF
ncbi:MAG: hypothetical protein JNJ60_12650 [Rhodocyclaceae bacterium]|nr:hypothetical protein [Rhodocyclaceae bacterium]